MRLGVNEIKNNAKVVHEWYVRERDLYVRRGDEIRKGGTSSARPLPIARLGAYKDVPADQWPDTNTAEGCFEVAEKIGEELRKIERKFPGVIPVDER